jgi:hypothetical protein
MDRVEIGPLIGHVENLFLIVLAGKTENGAPEQEIARLRRAIPYYNWAYTSRWAIYEVSLNGVPEF